MGIPLHHRMPKQQLTSLYANDPEQFGYLAQTCQSCLKRCILQAELPESYPKMTIPTLRRLIHNLTLIALTTSCSPPAGGGQRGASDRPTPDASTSTDAGTGPDWCRVYNEVFEPECASCHSPDAPMNVRPYLKVRGDFSADQLVAHLRNDRPSSPPWLTPREPDNSHIWTRVGDGSMPPDVTMGGSQNEDSRLRKLVRDWIANGGTSSCVERPDAGPVDAGTSDAQAPDAGAPDAGAPDASASDTGPEDAGAPADPMCGVAVLFRTSCHGCHRNGTGGYSTGDGSLRAIRASFADTASVGIPYVTSGDSSQSYLFLRIAGRGAEIQGGRAGRMPPGGRWAEDDIRTLENWIDEGTPNVDCP